MRIDDLFLTESQNLEEGPIWDKVKGAGAAVGKGIGAVGQAVGAVAGVPAGIAGAVKKGYQASRDTIAGGPGSTPQPAQGQSPAAGAQAAPQAGTMAPAASGSAPQAQAAAPTAAQAQQSKVGVSQINKILPTLRARDLASIKKTLDATLAKKQKAPAPGAGAMSQMANTLTGTPAPSAPPANTMANAPVSKTNTAKPGNPNAAPTGLPPGVNPEKANAAQQAAGLPPLYKQTADGGWEETDQAKGSFVGNQTQAAPTKTRTGGKVAGQVSNSPSAVRQRAARQAKQATSKVMAEGVGYHSKFFGKMI
jgi:hypothetical protein